MKYFAKDLTWKFGCLMSLIAVLITVAAKANIMHAARTALEVRLGEKAAFINNFYAVVVADALQRKDDVTLLQWISSLERDQEVTSVVVVDQKSQVRYHIDAEKVGTTWEDPLVKKALETGEGEMKPFKDQGGRALALISPLKVHGLSKPIGVIRINMTYRHLDKQVGSFDTGFYLTALGLISTAIGVMIIFVKRWVIVPLEMERNIIMNLNPASAEANLPETTDDFGLLNQRLNEMILRFKAEMQNQGSEALVHVEHEKALMDAFAVSFLADMRVLIADKDNRILSDLGPGAGTPPLHHLLDLAGDQALASLITVAFQQEGHGMKGDVTFQGRPCHAVALRIPEGYSQLVKTIVALKIGH